MAQQDWRTRAPKGVSLPDLHARRVVKHVRGRAGQIKRLAYGLTHYQTPLMPYLMFRKRSTDNPYSLYARLRCSASLLGPADRTLDCDAL